MEAVHTRLATAHGQNGALQLALPVAAVDHRLVEAILAVGHLETLDVMGHAQHI